MQPLERHGPARAIRARRELEDGRGRGPLSCARYAGADRLQLRRAGGILVCEKEIQRVALLVKIDFVGIAVVVALWEMDRGFQEKGINLPQEPLAVGAVVMVVVAYCYGAPSLVTATAVTALATMLWLLRRGVDGYVRDASASIFRIPA